MTIITLYQVATKYSGILGYYTNKPKSRHIKPVAQRYHLPEDFKLIAGEFYHTDNPDVICGFHTDMEKGKPAINYRGNDGEIFKIILQAA